MVTFNKQSYADKSSAKRAAKSAGLADAEIKQNEQGRWQFAVKDTPKRERQRSTAESPCAVVWSLVDEMKGERRKDIVAAAVAKGVHPGTARVQAQKALKAQRI